MTRITEKLRFRIIPSAASSTTSVAAAAASVLSKSATSFSIKLACFSLYTLRHCKSLARFFLSKALSIFAMDDLYDDDASTEFLPETGSRFSLSYLNNGHLDYDDYDGNGEEKVYLVPFRLLKETQTNVKQVEGMLYAASTNDDFDSEIFLDLRKEEDPGVRNGANEGSLEHIYALVPEALWLRALKKHNESNCMVTDVESGSTIDAGDYFQDVFLLKIRLSISWETHSLIVRISKKDNVVSSYKGACSIFQSKQKLLHLWDFSGKTTQYFVNGINLPCDYSRVPDKEILLELQVHGFSYSMMYGDVQKCENSEGLSKWRGFGSHGIVKMNGNINNMNSNSSHNFARNNSIYGPLGSSGLTGLQNLGNTCFMSSAIQCLAHTSRLVDFFLDDYRLDINRENPLGMNGKLALVFGDLLRKLWAPGAAPVAPRLFKLKLAKFAPQFSGWNQHDSQEFLAFLLDGLHEDLNRVKHKPYVEAKDTERQPDEEVSEEYWKNHLARNDSIIVNLFQGQYRSTLVCPACNKMSVTFDPFMYLTLPLPSTTMRTMTLTILSPDGSTLPAPFTVTVPKCGTLKDLIDALRSACSLKSNESLLVAEIYKNRIVRLLEAPSDLLALIRDNDQLVAYRLPKVCETSSLVVFTHMQKEKSAHSSTGSLLNTKRPFGIPLVARLSNTCTGYDICKTYLQLLEQLKMPNEESGNDDYDAEMEDAVHETIAENDSGFGHDTWENTNSDFQFFLTDDKGFYEGPEIKMKEPLPDLESTGRLNVLVLWSDRMLARYDTCLLSSLPEVCKPQLFTQRLQESVSLYKCLEAFLKEEPLGPEDMWYCPKCKKPRQASKKLDLWRLPEILVIHLKRFSYSRFFKNKLEAYVDFPVDDLDLSTYIASKGRHSSSHYKLYAISNHYGGMGGGHYTAFVHHGHGRWYEFDDSRVSPIDEDKIKTSAAYVLFYRRVPNI